MSRREASAVARDSAPGRIGSSRGDSRDVRTISDARWMRRVKAKSGGKLSCDFVGVVSNDRTEFQIPRTVLKYSCRSQGRNGFSRNSSGVRKSSRMLNNAK